MHIISVFNVAAILIFLATILGYANHKISKLPSTVGLTLMAMIASISLLLVSRLLHTDDLTIVVSNFLNNIDFHKTLMEGMLSFLLFAGALHVDWGYLRKASLNILILSTIGVIFSTTIVGYGTWLLLGLFGIKLSLMWCLVFGALISPTDPVAVMGILKVTKVPANLQATIAGESLFNDGIGVVIFSILLTGAMSNAPITIMSAASGFLHEAVGGALLGLALGFIAYRAMRNIDDYHIEVLISLSVVMMGYSIAQWLHVSGPVAMAVAGLMIGNAAVENAMSDTTRDYLIKFWELIDEILNAILFLLIGLEFIIIAQNWEILLIGLIIIPLVIMARGISVFTPLFVLRSLSLINKLSLTSLVWGGLRGGISVALALSLPSGETRDIIVGITYAVVLFSILVQGGTIGKIINKLTNEK